MYMIFIVILVSNERPRKSIKLSYLDWNNDLLIIERSEWEKSKQSGIFGIVFEKGLK